VSPSRSDPIGRPTSQRFAMSNTHQLDPAGVCFGTPTDDTLTRPHKILTPP
jgi:hypothetical protein